jgi:hypothetical protein
MLDWEFSINFSHDRCYIPNIVATLVTIDATLAMIDEMFLTNLLFISNQGTPKQHNNEP